jgi:hypothetical protein
MIGGRRLKYQWHAAAYENPEFDLFVERHVVIPTVLSMALLAPHHTTATLSYIQAGRSPTARATTVLVGDEVYFRIPGAG